MGRELEIDPFGDPLFRHEAGRLVAGLTGLFGSEHLEAAERVVHETQLQARREWRSGRAPSDPRAWLRQAAREHALEALRGHSDLLPFDPAGNSAEAAVDGCLREDALPEAVLRLLHACCHPGLAVESRLALVLKALCGFNRAEIAAAFRIGEDTVSKRLHRGREFFRAQRLPLDLPPEDDRGSRAGSVIGTLHRIFNESYGSYSAGSRLRKDLMAGPMALCRLLAGNPRTEDPRAWALLALMCFHAGRTGSHLTAEGALILLPDEDRSRWDRRLMMEGHACMDRAAYSGGGGGGGGGEMSAYHLEAAIAAEHCDADSFATVNWKRILGHYEALARLAPGPVVELNRIIVVMQVNGLAVAQAQLETVPDPDAFAVLPMYHGLKGEIRARLDDRAGAREAWEEAARLTGSEAERRLFKGKIAGLA